MIVGFYKLISYNELYSGFMTQIQLTKDMTLGIYGGHGLGKRVG